MDSSDDSSGEDSEDSETEEDMLRQLQEIIRHNQQIEVRHVRTSLGPVLCVLSPALFPQICSYFSWNEAEINEKVYVFK